MKKIFQICILVCSVSLLLLSCASKQKPSLIEMQKEKMTLVQVLKTNSGITDVFGDSLNTNQKYYVYTKHQLVPVSYMTEGNSTSLQQRLDMLGLRKNDGSDTLDITVGFLNNVVTVRQFRLQNIRLTPPQLY